MLMQRLLKRSVKEVETPVLIKKSESQPDTLRLTAKRLHLQNSQIQL